MSTVTFDWDTACADRVRGLAASEIRKALDSALDPGLISLAGGVPAGELFPVERFREAFAKVLRDSPTDFLQYGHTEGVPALREFLADHLTQRGTAVQAGQLLITNGSQQGLDLVGRLLLNPGDEVVVESPSYLGALETFRQYHAAFRPIATDAEGIRTDLLENMLIRDRAGPRRIRMLYTMPNFANPSGLTMSLARRRALVDLSHRFGLPVVEDDAYGQLRFEGSHLPSLFAMDDIGTVIHLGTFSKILSPGLRIGWTAAHPRFLSPLIHLKERSDLHSAEGAQLAVVEVTRDGFLQGHVERLAAAYRERRDAAEAAAVKHFPPGITWASPQGGFYLWCALPDGYQASTLLTVSMSRYGVAFVPGRDFHAGATRPETVRISFSAVTPSLVEEGVRRMGAAFHSVMREG